MHRNYNDDFDDYVYKQRECVKDIKSLRRLYQFRHYCNIFGGDIVSKEANVDTNRLWQMDVSNIHGSEEVKSILQSEDFEKLFTELQTKYQEEEDAIQKALDKNEEFDYEKVV